MSGWVSFRTVKESVSMEMALASYGVRLNRLNESYYRGKCPLPAHRSGSSALSFVVNVDKNAWACHSASCSAARGGRIGGNVIDFVAAMEGCSVRDAALKLQDWFALRLPAPAFVSPATRPGSEPAAFPEVPEANEPLSFRFAAVDHVHPYLAARGVDVETARLFGVGYHLGKGLMEGRIVIPIHDENGALVAYAGRSLDSSAPKYRLPPRFRKSHVLFNLNRAAGKGKRVVLVEGFFDAIRVHQAGLPCVVAMMGCSLSLRQEELLKGYFDSVVLLLDGDAAGLRASESIAARLIRAFSVRLAAIPDGRQPDSLGFDQIRCLCDSDYF
jgi:DNA primase